MELGSKVAIHAPGDFVTRSGYAAILPPHAHLITSPTVGPQIIGYSPKGERWARSAEAATFDVLHQHGIWPASSRVTACWRKWHQRPVVISPQGSLEPYPLMYSRWKKRMAWLAYERENLMSAACLQATAAEEIQGFRDAGLKQPVAVIPNGIPTSWPNHGGDGLRFRAANRLPFDARLFLYLSRIHRKKGLLELVQGLSSIAASLGPWHLVVAGPIQDQAYYAGVMEAAAAGGIADRIHYVGGVWGAEKCDAFAAADVFVLPTHSDNFAIAVAEALGAAVPVLTTHGALPWHRLEREGCGWWVSISGIPEKLLEITTMSRSSLMKMGRRGRQLVQAEFLWSDIASRTIALYRWLLGERPQPDFVVTD